MTRVAISLSGGGARGDFQVGAVRCLYDHGIQPTLLCTTSVGSVNGLKLAEGEGSPDQGLWGLENIWLALQSNDDMFQPEPWTKDPALSSYLSMVMDLLSPPAP